MNKAYIIIENNDGNSGGLGEFVSMMSLYNLKEEAEKRLEELNNKLGERGLKKESEDNTRYLYKMIEIEVGKEANIFLGGYRKYV